MAADSAAPPPRPSTSPSRGDRAAPSSPVADGPTRGREHGRLRRHRPRASTTAPSGPSATSTCTIRQHEITAFIGPSGCGKTTVLRCFNRMNDLIDGARVEGKLTLPRRRPVRPRASTPSRCGAASAWCSRSRTRSPSRSTTTSPTARSSTACKGNLDDIVEQALRRRRAVGRGQGPAQGLGPGPVRRPAAAAVHRPGHRRRARGAPDGRALLGARPDRHRAHRGPDAGDQGRATRSSSSPTTCSRPPGSATAPRSSPPR